MGKAMERFGPDKITLESVVIENNHYIGQDVLLLKFSFPPYMAHRYTPEGEVESSNRLISPGAQRVADTIVECLYKRDTFPALVRGSHFELPNPNLQGEGMDAYTGTHKFLIGLRINRNPGKILDMALSYYHATGLGEKPLRRALKKHGGDLDELGVDPKKPRPHDLEPWDKFVRELLDDVYASLKKKKELEQGIEGNEGRGR